MATLILGSTGCQDLQSLLDTAPKPQASIKSVGLEGLDPQRATLSFGIEISNPYQVPLPLAHLSYVLASGEDQILEGEASVGGTVPAKGSRLVSVPASILFAHVLSTLQGVRPGAVIPYDAQLELSVDAPGVGPLKLPMRHAGKLPIPAIPKVELASVQWKELSLNEASAILNLRVQNTNQFPLDISTLAYQLSLGGTQVAQSSLARSVRFSEGQQNDVQIPLSLSPAKLGMGAFQVLRGKGAGYDISGSLDGSTPFGPIQLPFQHSGTTTFTR